MLIDLYTFQDYDGILESFRNNNNVYKPDGSRSALIGDDAHISATYPDTWDKNTEPVIDRVMFLNAYNWLIMKMKQHHVKHHDGTMSSINDASYHEIKYDDNSYKQYREGNFKYPELPIWFYAKWVKFDKNSDPILPASMKPDRRLSEFKWASDYDLLHVRMDASRLLFTDFDAWNQILNRGPLPPLNYETEWTDEQRDEWFESLDDMSKQDVVNSWDNSIITNDEYILAMKSASIEPRFIQATCWELTPVDIIKVYKSKKRTK